MSEATQKMLGLVAIIISIFLLMGGLYLPDGILSALGAHAPGDGAAGDVRLGRRQILVAVDSSRLI